MFGDSFTFSSIFSFTTSELELGYNHHKLNIRVDVRIAEQLKIIGKEDISDILA